MTYLMKNVQSGCHGNQNQQNPKCVMALVPWKPLFMQLMPQETLLMHSLNDVESGMPVSILLHVF